ncbi:MAG: YlbF family regulator, partial [Clostridia bacterium]|nr:YlbF family regulator [Clostridia bacterium]
YLDNEIKGEIKMRNQIIDKAQELGTMIAESEERVRMTEASDKMNANEEAVELLRTYNENRKKATEKLRGTNPSKEELQEFKAYVQAEFEKVVVNPLISEYIEASRDFDNMVQQVNAVLSYFITGQESSEGGCSGNCSSCSSCH